MEKLHVKKLGLVVVLTCIAFFAQAQTGTPVWTTSKDVQKVANKSLFSDQNLKASHINAVSAGYPAVTLSKGIVKVTNANLVQDGVKGNVVSKGYPMWTVSKGVHKYNR
jgi:hypothetical protein